MSTSAPEGSLRLLVDEVLAEQAQLSAVERFALSQNTSARPALEPWYEELIPAARPGAGEQYAFRVDLDACTGCKACVTACHSLNGLDEGETWRKVGLLVAGDAADGAQQTVTGACHHCADPGCMKGCPVRAYEKDETTGIVRHLDDQCIGCKYCTLTCPYDVPQYNERLGIVRKCDMCTGRLEQGEAPACVQGCPNGAISIEVVPVAGGEAAGAMLPTAPETLASASTTGPTTRYVGDRRSAERPWWRPADLDAIEPGDAHWPLAILLVCTQLSVGLFSALIAMTALGFEGVPLTTGSIAALSFALVGQGAAFAHLGRPQYAFRALLGLRTSWMSREIVALGAYFSLLAGYVAATVFVPAVFPDLATTLLPLVPALGVSTALAGWVGVVTSIMIYGVTGRPSWTIRRTALRFAGAAVVTGSLGACALSLLAGSPLPVSLGFFGFGAIATIAVVVAEARHRARDLRAPNAARKRAARIESERLGERVRLRTIAAALGVAGLALAIGLAQTTAASSPILMLVVAGAFASSLVATITERNLFFVTEASRGMPGV